MGLTFEEYMPMNRSPSTNIAHAWEVVEKICGDDTFGTVYIRPPYYEEKRYNFCFTRQSIEYRPGVEDFIGSSSGISAPHVICLAALKAVGVEGDGIHTTSDFGCNRCGYQLCRCG